MEPSATQYQTLRDALARRVIARSKDTDAATSDLDEFINYLALQLWPSLPTDLQDVTYETRSGIPDTDTISLDALPVEFTETLVSYRLAEDVDGVVDFVRKVLGDYAEDACAPPPVWSATRTSECEICEREVPLTYHHLIPRSTHTKALKKKWHPESQLNSVAWLCRCVEPYSLFST